MKGKTCHLHYLENAFGLVALECPKCKKLDRNCRDRMQVETDMAMGDLAKYTYVDMELLFAPARHTWFLHDVPAFTIRCWHCGFGFYKGRKATSEERKKNEREAEKYLEELPEASPELKRVLKKGKRL